MAAAASAAAYASAVAAAAAYSATVAAGLAAYVATVAEVVDSTTTSETADEAARETSVSLILKDTQHVQTTKHSLSHSLPVTSIPQYSSPFSRQSFIAIGRSLSGKLAQSVATDPCD